MSVLDDQEKRAKAERAAQRVAKERAAQFKKDVQDLMALPAMRRVLSDFIDDAGLDRSTYRDDHGAMACVAGWQDAARWWIDAVRQHCPERETAMRAEARSRAKQEAREGDTNEDDDAS